MDVNADGSRIVGHCCRTYGTRKTFAALWTQETGFVSLQDLLVNEYGLGEELEGWSLDASTISPTTGVSSLDGRPILRRVNS